VENPDWAYPVGPPPVPPDNTVLKQMPGSTRQYTQAQINDGFNPPDWYPDEHPPMPRIVSNGHAPSVRACTQCHLTSGSGHPESSSVAGLPVAYVVRQFAAFKNGERKGIRATNMIEFAKAISDDEVRISAEYFSGLKPRPWIRVVETDTVPVSRLGPGTMRFAVPEGGTEPIGNRIIELPEDPVRAQSRDPHSGFVAHVPTGSLTKALVSTGNSGKTIPCAICHGQTLQGLGEVPSIVGRSPMYMFRQLNDMQNGNRTGSLVALMQAVVAKLATMTWWRSRRIWHRARRSRPRHAKLRGTNFGVPRCTIFLNDKPCKSSGSDAFTQRLRPSARAIPSTGVALDVR
jgi:cytochrome c553